ncbi:hypothetical protein B0H14DRAFT_2585719 [Mycena olivaceomarginata]|nr:hypothetical protein B0H14DRAFT_2585719 [Mycena olivaceomarginata]
MANSASTSITTTNIPLEFPALPAIRVAQANTSPTDAVNTEPTVLEISLPSLRTAAARSNGNDEPAPLPTLRAARVLTPEPVEAEYETLLHTRRTSSTVHSSKMLNISRTRWLRREDTPLSGTTVRWSVKRCALSSLAVKRLLQYWRLLAGYEDRALVTWRGEQSMGAQPGWGYLVSVARTTLAWGSGRSMHKSNLTNLPNWPARPLAMLRVHYIGVTEPPAWLEGMQQVGIPGPF